MYPSTLIMGSALIMLLWRCHYLSQSYPNVDDTPVEGRPIKGKRSGQELYSVGRCHGEFAKRIVSSGSPFELKVQAERLHEVRYAVPSDYTAQYKTVVNAVNSTADRYQSIVEVHLTTWDDSMKQYLALSREADELSKVLHRGQIDAAVACKAQLDLVRRTKRASLEQDRDQKILWDLLREFSDDVDMTLKALDLDMNKRSWMSSFWRGLKLDVYWETRGYADSTWSSLLLTVATDPKDVIMDLWAYLSRPDPAAKKLARQDWRLPQETISAVGRSLTRHKQSGEKWVLALDAINHSQERHWMVLRMGLLEKAIREDCRVPNKDTPKTLTKRNRQLREFLTKYADFVDDEVENFMSMLGQRAAAKVVRATSC